MTSLIKKTLLGSLITTGVLLSFIFVFGSADPLSYAIAPKVPTLRVETLPKTAAVLSQKNITQEIARDIAQEIAKENPEGPGEGDQAGLTTVDPTQLTQDVLARAFEEVKIEDLRPIILLTDLTIIKSNEKSFAENYFNNINAILGKNFPEGVSVNWESPANTNFSALINAYALSMSESMTIAVPSALAELHRKYVSLLGAEKNTLTLIKNYLVDPAQAAVAIEAGNIFTAELEAVIESMNAYIDQHQLTLAS